MKPEVEELLRRKNKEGKVGHGGLSLDQVKARIYPVSKSIGKISGLVYGRSGTGKTMFAASIVDLPPVREFPNRDKVLLLDMREEGTDSIYDKSNIDVVDILQWGDFEGVYWYLRKSDHPYKAVILDTVTQLQFLAMDEAKRRAKKKKSDAMNKLAWGFLSSMLGPKMLDYRDLKLHSCFVAQDRRTVDVGDEEAEDLLPEAGPAVMPSVAKGLTAMVKFIGQTHIKQIQKPGKKGILNITQFRMRVGPHPYYLTKVRAPMGIKVPSSIPNPNFEKLVAIMRGTYTPEKKPLKKPSKPAVY